MSQTGPSGDHRNAASPRPLARSRLLVAVLGLLVLVGILTVPGFAGAQGGGDPSEIGSFEAAFEASDEFEFDRNARFGPSKPPFGSDSSKCVLVPTDEQDQKERDADPDRDGFLDCKVAANSTNVAPNGDFVYWNNLEATENVKGTIVSEYGVTSINDESRVLSNIGDKNKRKWSKPSPVDGGANPNGNMDSDPLIPGAESGEPGNDGSFFCADHNWLPDGRLLVTGGTEYSSDPGPPPELEQPGGDRMENALDGLSINGIVDLLKDLPGGTTVEDVADSVPGSGTSVGDLVDSLGLPGTPGSDDSDSDGGGDTTLGDLSNDQLEDLAKDLNNEQLEDLAEGLSDKERDALLPSAAGDPSEQNGTPEGSLEGIGKGSIGATELEGIKNSRIYDPETKKWTQTGSMSEGRWYPSITTLANGDQFVVSGLRKLIRGIYLPGDDEFGDPDEQGGNNEETETFDSDTGDWDLNGPKESEDPSDKELPLFARMHLLPNGHVYYSGGGQAFNPLGQDVNEAEWNMLASYDPEKKDWTTLGIPGLTDKKGGPTAPGTDAGFRGSTFSVQMPLKPDENGEYDVAEHLTAGGLAAAAAPSPGTYFPVKSSRITKVDTSGGTPTTETRDTGPLNQGGEKNTGRWYSSGTLLPTGEVLTSSGGDADEVALPGSEASIKTMELFDPRTETWRNVATAAKNRTYHNTATLLPDGRVVIGGLATISTGYGRNAGIDQPPSPAQQVPGSAAPPNSDGQITNVQGHDPTMEIYSPPNLFRGARPSITGDVACNQDYSDDLELDLDIPASQVDSVVAMRNASFDHITDADQKSVVLPIDTDKSKGNKVVVETPPSAEVAPPGPYLLFVNKKTPNGPTPSKQAEQVFFGGEGSCGRDDDNDSSNDNTPDGFEFGATDATSRCLAKGLKLGSQGIGGLQLGLTRAQTVLTMGKPANFARRAYRYCVNGGGRTYVGFSGGASQAQLRAEGAQAGAGGRAQFIVSVFGTTGPKGLTRGNSSASARRAYRRAQTVGRNHKNLVAPLPGGRGAIVIGFAKGKIRYLGVADRRVARNLNLLRYYLRGVRLQ